VSRKPIRSSALILIGAKLFKLTQARIVPLAAELAVAPAARKRPASPRAVLAADVTGKAAALPRCPVAPKSSAAAAASALAAAV
tara:strand:- start:43 stop:294 length:252 start_codon:yes stop_codon:yes gene_type:complete